MGAFLRAELVNNVFWTRLTASFEDSTLLDEDSEIEVQAVIDTGCSDSLVSYDTMFITFDKEGFLKQKEEGLRKRNYGMGVGVETKKSDVIRPTNIAEAINNPYVRIWHRFYNINVGGIDIGNRLLSVSYDTSDKVLLGMGFFKDWDIHIGKNKQGKTVLLACPNNQLNQDYYLALEKEFGISQKLNAAIVSNIQNRQKS